MEVFKKSILPSETIPLNRHSLMSLELWLQELGAQKSGDDPCCWSWSSPDWSAEIVLERDELMVTWVQNGSSSQCCFSYGLARRDVEAAIKEGPFN